MGNIAYISSRKNIPIGHVVDIARRVNDEFFGGYFGVEPIGTDEAGVAFYAEELDRRKKPYECWALWKYSPRRIGGKSIRTYGRWGTWAEDVFRNEVGHELQGRLSCEGVPGTQEPKPGRYRTFCAWLESWNSVLNPTDVKELRRYQYHQFPAEIAAHTGEDVPE